MIQGTQTIVPAGNPDPQADKIREAVFETLRVDLDHWGRAVGPASIRGQNPTPPFEHWPYPARTIAVLREAEAAGLVKIAVNPNPKLGDLEAMELSRPVTPKNMLEQLQGIEPH